MKRYSVRPITKREIILYELLTKTYTSRNELISKVGKEGDRIISRLTYEYNLLIKRTTICKCTYYTLLSTCKAFSVYEQWLTSRQDQHEVEKAIWLDWRELHLTYSEIGNRNGVTRQAAKRAIDKMERINYLSK